MNFNTTTTAACLLALLGNAAHADVFNGGFENGLNGWTIVNTPGGVGAPGSTELFDIDGDGALGTSQAAVFSVGQDTPDFGLSAGVSLSQSIELEGGQQYTVSFDWATVNDDFLINIQSGLFNLFIGGDLLAQGDGNIILENSSNFGRVEASYIAAATGSYQLEIVINRPFFADSNLQLRQYIDNVSVVAVPAPGVATFCLAGMGFAGSRRRR